MTSPELRRLADRKVSESTSLQRDADHLRSQAAGLQGLLDPLVSISQRVWRGPAASAFEAECVLHSRQLDDEAGRIVQIARELDAEARDLRASAAALRSRAAALDSAAYTDAGLPAGAS